MMCAVFVSSFSCVIRWRLGVSFSLSSRPSSCLPVSGSVSCLFFADCSLIRFILSVRRRLVSPSCLAVRFLVLFVVPRCLALFGSLFPVSCYSFRSGVSPRQSVFSFRSAARFDGSWDGSCHPSHSFLFSSLCLARLCLMAMGTAVACHLRLRLSYLVAACFFFSAVIRHRGVRVGWRKWACRSTIRDTSRFR